VGLFDTHQPDLARAHDFLLGGRHNFAADRALAGALVGADPLLADLLRENREFVRRAARYAAGQGVRQFLDVGSGLPFVHTVCPGSRVAYVDNDPAVRSYGGSLLAPNDGARFLDGDLAEPEALLSAAELAAVIDLTEPVCLILSLVLHLVEESTARGVTGVLVRALAPGSHVLISMTARPGPGTEAIEPLFGGLTVVPPGLVDARAWGAADPGPFQPRAEIILCGVGRKPL
jgi:SAM-dependent methyltransferase